MLIYIDVETTGLEQNDRICAVGLIVLDEEILVYKELIKPPKKMRPEASAINHITDEMLKEKKSFPVNIARRIVELRMQRRELLSTSSQLEAVYKAVITEIKGS